MEQIKSFEWLLEIDKQATISAYSDIPTPAESCGCSYCRNYVRNFRDFPSQFLSLLETFGADPSKPSEVYEVCKNEDGTHMYGGWYHIVGQIIEGRDVKVPIDEKTQQVGLFQLNDDFSFGFTRDIQLASKNFPRPLIQLEFSVNISWVLEEDPKTN